MRIRVLALLIAALVPLSAHGETGTILKQPKTAIIPWIGKLTHAIAGGS